jgi:hypothetical protein
MFLPLTRYFDELDQETILSKIDFLERKLLIRLMKISSNIFCTVVSNIRDGFDIAIELYILKCFVFHFLDMK